MCLDTIWWISEILVARLIVKVPFDAGVTTDVSDAKLVPKVEGEIDRGTQTSAALVGEFADCDLAVQFERGGSAAEGVSVGDFAHHS